MKLNRAHFLQDFTTIYPICPDFTKIIIYDAKYSLILRPVPVPLLFLFLFQNL